MVGQIQFLDWEQWHKQREDKVLDEVLIYLRDQQRVKGAGIRVLQYLVDASWGARPVAYDFYVYPSVVHLMPEIQAMSVRMIRCQQIKETPGSTAPPAFSYTDTDFSLTAFSQILKDLEAIELPHPLKHLVDAQGMDGANYEFAFNAPRDGIRVPIVTHLRYHWWGNEQTELKPLAEYWQEMRQKLDKMLDSP